MIYWELFWSFVQVGAFCVGGGYASMPLIQEQVIERHGWLTLQQFIDIFTISQMTPGPIGINAATFVGTKVAGVPGAIAATAGFVFPSIIIVLILAKLFFKYGDIGPIRGILNGLRPAVVALICSAIPKIKPNTPEKHNNFITLILLRIHHKEIGNTIQPIKSTFV